MTYTVQQGTARARTDLCDKHDGALRNILIGNATSEASQPTISEGRFEEMFASMEDIEKLRKDYLKTA